MTYSSSCYHDPLTPFNHTHQCLFSKNTWCAFGPIGSGPIWPYLIYISLSLYIYIYIHIYIYIFTIHTHYCCGLRDGLTAHKLRHLPRPDRGASGAAGGARTEGA